MYTCIAPGLHSPDVSAECNWYCGFADLETYNICPDCGSALSPTVATPFQFSERTPQDHAQHRLQQLYVQHEIPSPVPPKEVTDVILLISHKQGITPKNTRIIQDYEVSGVYVTPTANRPQAQSSARNRNEILKSVQIYTTPLPPLWIRSGAQAFVPELGVVKIIQINLAVATHPLPNHTAVATVGTIMHQRRADTVLPPYSTVPVTKLLPPTSTEATRYFETTHSEFNTLLSPSSTTSAPPQDPVRFKLFVKYHVKNLRTIQLV